jgi:hypothetical protein
MVNPNAHDLANQAEQKNEKIVAPCMFINYNCQLVCSFFRPFGAKEVMKNG